MVLCDIPAWCDCCWKWLKSPTRPSWVVVKLSVYPCKGPVHLTSQPWNTVGEKSLSYADSIPGYLFSADKTVLSSPTELMTSQHESQPPELSTPKVRNDDDKFTTSHGALPGLLQLAIDTKQPLIQSTTLQTSGIENTSTHGIPGRNPSNINSSPTLFRGMI